MSRPRAFLHFATFYPPYSFGGDSNYIEDLAHLLADDGHTVDIVHCVDSYHLLHPDPPPAPARPYPGVTVHALRSSAGWLSPLVTHATGRPGLKGRRIRDLLRSRRWDVVHFHNISLLGPRLMSLVPHPRETVTLYTAHEHWLVCPTHVMWKFGRRACEAPECLRCTLLARRPPQLWRYTGLLERSAAHVDRFLAPTRAVAATHAARGFPYPLTPLPYFAPRADADWREPPPRPHERPYFLFVGRLEALKGVRELVQAWRAITSVDLLLAGTGTIADEMKRLTPDMPHVRWLGAVPRERLGAYYVHALGCIVPSVGYETFGLIVLEALSRKVPVIARDFGALGEVAAESGGALLFRDDAGLVAAVDRLTSSPSLRAELGERGYRTFVERWSPEAHRRAYLGLIDAIAHDKQQVAGVTAG